MRTILNLVCSYRFEGCEFKEEHNQHRNDALQEGQKCPSCLEHNRNNPTEPVLVGSLEVAEFEIEKE